MMTYAQASAWLDSQPGTAADRETAIRRRMARGQAPAPAARVHAARQARPVGNPAADLAAAGRAVARLAAARERAELAAARNRRMAA